MPYNAVLVSARRLSDACCCRAMLSCAVDGVDFFEELGARSVVAFLLLEESEVEGGLEAVASVEVAVAPVALPWLAPVESCAVPGRGIICGVGSSSSVIAPVPRGSHGVALKLSSTVRSKLSSGGSRRIVRVLVLSLIHI